MTSRQKISYKFTKCLSFPILLSLSLVACDSGSSSDKTATDSAVLSGKISGVTLEGLSYQTASQSGKTSADSTFSYKEGELVSFFIGDISLGQSAAAAEISLFDMMGITEPETITQGVQTKLRATAYQSNRSPKTFPFERMSNLIVFLTAIDEDGIFSNGVTVPAQLETVAQGKNVDIIGKQIVAFESQLEDSKLLGEGVAEGLWSSKPTIVLPGVALDAFYDSIGMTPEIYTTSKRLIDTNSDGIYDGNDDLAFNYTFDDAGNVTSEHKQIIGSEADVEFTRYTYDANGKLTGTYIDFGDDGTMDRQQEWAYDVKGHETLNQTDLNGDGIFEYRTTHEINYHPDDSLAYYKEVTERYSDNTGVLESSETTIKQYDTEGRGNYYEQSYHIPAENIFEGQSERYTHDSAGNVTKVEEDKNLDGVIDVIHRYEFDENNKQTLAESDFNADGTPDSVVVTITDAASNQVTISYDNFAGDVPEQADGIIDSVAVLDYDSHDNKIRSRLDHNNDGSYEQETTWDITYDAEGRILSNKQVSTTSPEENYLTTYTYDSAGRMLTHQRVGDSEQVRNYLYTYTYDGEGNETTYSAAFDDSSISVVFHDEFGGQTITEYDSEGVATYTSSTLFDERGNYLGSAYIEGNSGIAQNKTKMTYNDNDQLTSEHHFNGGEEYLSKEYSYDEQGELSSTMTTNYMYPPESSSRYSSETYEYVDIQSWKALFTRFYRERDK